MDKPSFQKEILNRLKNEDVSALAKFEEFQAREMDLFDKIALTHEFIDLLSFKLRQSKCKMDKTVLSEFLFQVFKNTVKTYDYNFKFIAYQFKTLVIYHKNCKNFDKAIKILEFLIQLGISDAEGEKFHIQLDELYRLRRRRDNKLEKPSRGIKRNWFK
jgi:hypothetical protein